MHFYSLFKYFKAILSFFATLKRKLEKKTEIGQIWRHTESSLSMGYIIWTIYQPEIDTFKKLKNFSITNFTSCTVKLGYYEKRGTYNIRTEKLGFVIVFF